MLIKLIFTQTSFVISSIRIVHESNSIQALLSWKHSLQCFSHFLECIFVNIASYKDDLVDPTSADTPSLAPARLLRPHDSKKALSIQQSYSSLRRHVCFVAARCNTRPTRTATTKLPREALRNPHRDPKCCCCSISSRSLPSINPPSGWLEGA